MIYYKCIPLFLHFYQIPFLILWEQKGYDLQESCWFVANSVQYNWEKCLQKHLRLQESIIKCVRSRVTLKILRALNKASWWINVEIWINQINYDKYTENTRKTPRNDKNLMFSSRKCCPIFHFQAISRRKNWNRSCDELEQSTLALYRSYDIACDTFVPENIIELWSNIKITVFI